VLKVGSIFISAAAKSPAIIPLIKAIGMDPTDNVEHEMINLTLTAAICGLAALVHQKVLESPFNI
jgi:hypothetical protein